MPAAAKPAPSLATRRRLGRSTPSSKYEHARSAPSHWPVVHAALQRLRHEPQLVGSMRRSASQPSLVGAKMSALQSPHSASQRRLHSPSTQAPDAFASE